MSDFVISPLEMYVAEKAVFESGLPSFELMRLAGEGVADIVHDQYPDGAIRVLCGRGGNGGDGFVAAARLANLGRVVSVYLLGAADDLNGDCRTAASLWGGAIHPLSEALGAECDITIDALFGGGLSRSLGGVPAELAESVRGVVVSVDVPSGLDGLNARSLGSCFQADLTVTFAALRPAHVLAPGREMCGRVDVLDIGVPVPCHTEFRPIKADEKLGAYVIEDDAALDLFLAGERLKADNQIEAMRLFAQKTGKPTLLSGPNEILSKANGEVVISPTK
ncbi:MAG: NAD(P)H-hydrate epimerase [Pseudomonadota bacterium]